MSPTPQPTMTLKEATQLLQSWLAIFVGQDPSVKAHAPSKRDYKNLEGAG